MIYFEQKLVDGKIETTHSTIEELKEKKPEIEEYYYYGDLVDTDDPEYLRNLDYRERAKGLN